jgi:hypothetical protein
VKRAELAEHQVGFDGCDQRLDERRLEQAGLLPA